MKGEIGRIFGLKKYAPGATSVSAGAENRKASLLEQISNLTVMAPLFMRRNGVGVQIGITQQPNGDEVAYPCRVVAALLNNEPMTTTQREAPQDPAQVTYTVKPDARATGLLPPGVDFTRPLAVRYGRPFGDTAARVLAAAPNDLCFVSSFQSVPELWIISERVATRVCTPTPPPAPPVDDPPPGQLNAGNSSVVFTNAADTTPKASARTPDPQMATHAISENVQLDASVQEGITPSFYVGDADYVTLTGSIQLGTIKSGWLRDLLVEWSADNRMWQQAAMIDPTAGTKALAVINTDGFISLDVREGIGYVRARWDSGGTLAAAGTNLELRWSKKRGTAR